MDTFAVSVTSGVTIKSLCFKYACKFSFFFGIFQALMLFIGWLTGFTIRGYLQNFSHWVAFILLLTIGIKMIYESFIVPCDEKCDKHGLLVLTGLAFATSLDALSVGISFSLLGCQIVTPIIIVGIVTFLAAMIGIYIGGKLTSLFSKRMELAGGIILIAIGFSILLK
ncbi:MAG: manganese efflux pump MntP family protein [Candidatus Cloacimonas sp.]|jgi:putative Mn2+ efflux pump MntP|nr:manganese efflux pump MntP family protein [Candidatus Cloacimonadota bacterium]